MSLPIQVNYNQSQIHVEVYKAGILNAAGHDLELNASKFHLDITETSEKRFPIKITIDAHNLKVYKTLSPSIMPLSPKDISEIETTIKERILLSSKYPHIVFSAEEIIYQGPKSYTFMGNLSLKDTIKPVTISCEVIEKSEIIVHGKCVFLQSHFGITPYSAMFGALKIQDKVCITFRLVFEKN